jgi:hypothetical protein
MAKTRRQELDSNPNRLKNESNESYTQRVKYNAFRLKQQENKNPVKKYWNEIEDNINNESNYFLKSAEQIATSPIRFAKYLNDKIDIQDVNKYRNEQARSEVNQKGLSSAMDTATLVTLGGLDKGLKAKAMMRQLAEKYGKYQGEQFAQDVGFGIYNIDAKADGGYINNELNPKYNNYLNMRQYAQGGNLTRFDEGGTHESSPLGGIPQGQAPDGGQNRVEQGESKKGNFIYSNRIALDKGLVKQFNLPGYVAGKSVSDASKAIDDKFKDRADKYAQETKKTLLDRLAGAQEYLKQQEQSTEEQANQSMQANSQQIPDQMNGQIPEGMEEYAEGAANNPQEEQAENIQTPSPIAAFGGYQQHRYSGLDNPNSEMNVANPAASATGLGGVSGADIAGAAAGLYQAGQSAFGKSAVDTSGKAASGHSTLGGGAMKGFQSTAAIGLNPATLAATGGLSALLPVVTGVAGLFGAKKDQRAEAKNTNNFALNTNQQYDNNHAYGGVLGGDPPKKIRNADGSYSYVTTNTRQVTPGTTGTRIPGTPGSPAVLPTTGVNSPDIGRNKAFATARAAGQPTFMYNGKSYTTEMSGTPGRPAVNPTPDVVTPSIPPTYETNTAIEPIPSQVYNVNATRGTIGGMVRPGVGGSITPQSQITQNQAMADRTINANTVYNRNLAAKYAPDVENLRGLNPEQLARKNAMSAQRLQELQGTASAKEIPTQLGLEKKTVKDLKQQSSFAYGGNMNQYVVGGMMPFQKDLFAVKQNLTPKVTQDLMRINDRTVNSSALSAYNNEAINPGLYATSKETDKDRYSLKNRLGRAGEVIGENTGDAMRLAPVAMNAYQLAKLQKPKGFQYDTLNNRYVPQYVDEAQMQRTIDQEGNNQMSALGQIGGSEGATRNAILAMGLNKTKGLSDAYANAAAQNRAQNASAQQFNLGVDSQNVAIRNKGIDERRADEGAYDAARSKYISAIGTDIGDIGKEKNASDAAIAMFGYTRKGKYVVDKNGNKISPEVLARKQADYATYISEQNKKATT